MQDDDAPVAVSLDAACCRAVERLSGLYGWQLDAAGRQALAGEVVHLLAGTRADRRTIEQHCCRIHFASLFAALERGGRDAEAVLAELFTIHWPDDGGTEVRYNGYLLRSALVTIRRLLAGSALSPADYEQMAADAAARALTAVRDRFRDCRDPDAFWGWTARVAERAAIDELRSGRSSGGRSVHASSLDQREESGSHDAAHAAQPAANVEDRQVDAIAVRAELIRKCRLGKLSVDQREALLRSFWGGEKPQEIAAALSAERGASVTAAQVSLWKHRGLQIMEANLRGRGYG